MKKFYCTAGTKMICLPDAGFMPGMSPTAYFFCWTKRKKRNFIILWAKKEPFWRWQTGYRKKCGAGNWKKTNSSGLITMRLGPATTKDTLFPARRWLKWDGFRRLIWSIL